MNSTEQKAHKHIAENIGDYVNVLSDVFQHMLLEAFKAGYQARCDEELPKNAVPIKFVAKFAGTEYVRKSDGKYYTDSIPNIGVPNVGWDKSRFLPDQYAITSAQNINGKILHVDHECEFDGESYTIFSFSEDSEGTIFASVGPNIHEYLDKDNTKRMKLIDIDTIP